MAAIVGCIQVYLTPDQEALLSYLARTAGRKPNDVAREILGSYLERGARFRVAVELGREQIALGQGIAHEDVVARFAECYGA